MDVRIYNDGKGNFFITEPFTLDERKKLKDFVLVECDEVYRKSNEKKGLVGLTGTWGYVGDVMQFNPAHVFTPKNLT